MKPKRVHNFGTYFVTSATWERRALFRSELWARLFLETLYEYRSKGKYLLHDFVLMPDHFHLLITPLDLPLERAVQFLKGGLSYRASHELGSTFEIWQKGFTDHRVRDSADYERCREYVRVNPVRAGLCQGPHLYPFGSAYPGSILDDVPQRLKPAEYAVFGTVKPCPSEPRFVARDPRRYQHPFTFAQTIILRLQLI